MKIEGTNLSQSDIGNPTFFRSEDNRQTKSFEKTYSVTRVGIS